MSAPRDILLLHPKKGVSAFISLEGLFHKILLQNFKGFFIKML